MRYSEENQEPFTSLESLKECYQYFRNTDKIKNLRRHSTWKSLEKIQPRDYPRDRCKDKK